MQRIKPRRHFGGLLTLAGDAQAVQVIHQARIVHADLKPANFLMVEGQLKLIDFGIAKAIHGDTTSISRESQAGRLLVQPHGHAVRPTMQGLQLLPVAGSLVAACTPLASTRRRAADDYLPAGGHAELHGARDDPQRPRQWRQRLATCQGAACPRCLRWCSLRGRTAPGCVAGVGQLAAERRGESLRARPAAARKPSGRAQVGRPSDIWSLGCILYQMVYGHTPFAPLAFVPKMHAIVDPHHQIPYPDVGDPALVDAMRRCLDRNPATRITMQARSYAARPGRADGVSCCMRPRLDPLMEAALHAVAQPAGYGLAACMGVLPPSVPYL